MEECNYVVEADEPASLLQQLSEEPLESVQHVTMTEEEFAAAFESDPGLEEAPRIGRTVTIAEAIAELELCAADDAQEEDDAIAPAVLGLPKPPTATAPTSRRQAVPRPSSDFSDMDYDVLRVQTQSQYGYEGEFDSEGKRCGRGVYRYPDGVVYEGMFEDNLRNGYGKLTYPNGDVYEGEWRRGRKEGQAASGEVYEGLWKNDRRHGQGKYCYPDGMVFEGRFQNDKKSGFGKFLYANGEVHVGQFKNGKVGLVSS
jgi:hypothetical protein